MDSCQYAVYGLAETWETDVCSVAAGVKFACARGISSGAALDITLIIESVGWVRNDCPGV